MSESKSILIIDDEPFIRDVVATILRRAGYVPFLAANGSMGLHLMRRHQPGIALVDIGLPNEKGEQVMEEIKKESPDTRVYAMTGTPGYELDPCSGPACFDGLLKKPFTLSTLVSLVDNC